MNHDAVEVLEHMIPEQSLATFQLYFPDPWHKARHHKRRIVQPEFIENMRHKLVIGRYDPYGNRLGKTMLNIC